MLARRLGRGVALVTVLAFGASACANGDAPLAPQMSGRIEIIEDEAQLAQRVVEHEPIPLGASRTAVLAKRSLAGSGCFAAESR